MDFRKVLDQTVREIRREVNLKVLKVPEIEQKVLDATSDEPWGPHGSDLADIARATKSYTLPLRSATLPVSERACRAGGRVLLALSRSRFAGVGGGGGDGKVVITAWALIRLVAGDLIEHYTCMLGRGKEK
ncbi:OSJNBb0021A09.20 [Oryza sativa (japonica cultivar-group)]